jgi:hypothetical protein
MATIAQTPTNLNTLSVELTGRPATLPAADPFRQAVRQVSELAHAKLPEALHGNLERATALVLHRHVWREDDGRFQVLSSDGASWYRVNGHCTCYNASEAPEGLCKHRLAAMLYHRASELVREQGRQGLRPATGALALLADAVEGGTPDHREGVSSPSAGLPEAPASVNCHVMIQGRQVQVTLRGTDETVLLERLAKLLAQYPCTPVAAHTPAVEAAANPLPTAAAPQEGWCAVHQVAMKQQSNERGSWYSHPLDDGRWCKGPKKAKDGRR